MNKLLNLLDGKKTYIAAGLTAGATLAYLLGFLNDEQYKACVGVLVAFGLYSTRSAIRKLEK